MSKRFTESDKWKDEWFVDLSPTAKLVFLYLLDNCDNAGFMSVNKRINAFIIGIETEEYETALDQLSRSLWKSIDARLVWVEKFIYHQKNLPLNPKNNAHRQIIGLLNINNPKFERDILQSPSLGADKGLISPIGMGMGIGKGIGMGKEEVGKEDAGEGSAPIEVNASPPPDGWVGNCIACIETKNKQKFSKDPRWLTKFRGALGKLRIQVDDDDRIYAVLNWYAENNPFFDIVDGPSLERNFSKIAAEMDKVIATAKPKEVVKKTQTPEEAEDVEKLLAWNREYNACSQAMRDTGSIPEGQEKLGARVLADWIAENKSNTLALWNNRQEAKKKEGETK